jgi:hypothetical protein
MSPGIDSKELIPPTYLTGRQIWLSHRPTRLVPEIIDPVFAKTSQNARFLLSENERFGLVFVKTGSINSGMGINS